MISHIFALVCLIPLAFCANFLSSIENCLTSVGSVSLRNVPTSRSTQTVVQADATARVTVYPTSTVTPAAMNSTTTVTQTSYTQASSNVPLVTSTWTVTAYTTTRLISTSTITSTSFRYSTSTTTIPTPSGFRAIADTTASVYPGLGHGNSTVTMKSLSSKGSSSSAAQPTTARQNNKPFHKRDQHSNGKSFPQVVNCKQPRK